MNYKLTQGNSSNYEIILTVTPDELAANKNKVLKQFQKDMKMDGFRQGQVPMNMVEKNVQPAYLQLALVEEAIHAGTMQVVQENEEIKFIGNIYDLGQEEKDGNMTFTYKLDIYPEVTNTDKKRESAKIEAINDQASEDEINETLVNLQKQYANYEPHDTLEATDTIAKATFVILDEKGEEIDKGSLFLGKEDFAEFEILKTVFVGKKEGEDIQFDYSEDLPPMLQLRNKDATSTPTHIKASINDIKKVTLPERTEANIKKFFGNEELSTLDQLKIKIGEAISGQKKESLLMQAVESYLASIKNSFTVMIPKTLIEEEVKSREASLQERMGGEEGLKQYYEKIGEEEKNKMLEEIKSAAKASLEKFFLLRKVIELLSLEIEEKDRQTPLSIENKLYTHFNG